MKHQALCSSKEKKFKIVSPVFHSALEGLTSLLTEDFSERKQLALGNFPKTRFDCWSKD